MAITPPAARLSRLVRHVLLLPLALLSAGAALAQEASTTLVTQQQISALEQEVLEADLADENRARLVADLESATAALSDARDLSAAARDLADRLDRSSEEIARFESLIREADATELPPVDDSLSIDELEAQIQLLVAERRSATARRSAIDTELSATRLLGNEERERLVNIQGQLESLPTEPLSVTAPLQERVSRTLGLARRARLSAEAELLSLQMRAQPALDSILTAERNWLDVKINRLDRQLQAFVEAAREAREREARRQIAEAQDVAAEMQYRRPALLSLAEENTALAQVQESLNAELSESRQRILELRETLDAIERDASLSRRRLAISGLQPELADVMLTRLRTLPSPKSIAGQIESRNRKVNEVALFAIDYDEEIRELSDRNALLDQRFPDYASWDNEARESLNQLLQQRVRLLRDTTQTLARLQQLLIDTNELAGNLYAAIQQYEEFLTSNLLWTRNYRYMNPGRLAEQAQMLLSPDGLQQLGETLPRSLLGTAPVFLSLLVAVLVLSRRRIKRELANQLGKPLRPSDERVVHIASSIGLSLGYTLPVPLAVYIMSLVIHNAAGDSAQLSGIATGLTFASLLLFCFGFLRHITGRLGAGRRRLKWNGQKMDCLRPALSWLAPVAVTGSFLAGFGLSTAETESGGPITAIATLAIALALMLFAARALRSGLFSGDRVILYGFRAAVLLGAAIVIMHLTGHLFAAHLYLKSLGLSVAAFLLVLFTTNVLYRVVLIFNARIQRRARAASREPHAGVDTDNPEDHGAAVALSGANIQLLSLLRVLGLVTALWLIWSPALPALNIFNEIGLWTVADSTLPAGELRTVSLATLIYAVSILVMTALVMRYLPPLVDVLLTEWSGTSAGSRYAIRMLMQYVIIGIGLAMSLSLLGWEWSKVQWLVAALGVGIGFGLQEIVANFISGLILLFERPIRVGDIVTAGGGDGTVTRINARATVIESFDGKELMVPNKELITSVVTNWSLSTSNLRVVITVGVAYGSDVREAMRILVDVARDNPSILDEPAPVSTFEDFGDNALVLWLRCFTAREYPRVWTELRTEINERFNEAGISIAFPQRDVHLDAGHPIPVEVVSTRESGPGGA